MAEYSRKMEPVMEEGICRKADLIIGELIRRKKFCLN